MPVVAFSGGGRAVSKRVLFQMAIIGFCTGLVKIAGAAKVVFSARAFGVGDAADAYFIAFLVVSFFGDTLAGRSTAGTGPDVYRGSGSGRTARQPNVCIRAR